MISVFFVPGIFGTTVEHVLRNYTKEYVKTKAEILDDGSMHSFPKEYHPISIESLHCMPERLNEKSIVTPIYPFKDMKLSDIIEQFNHNNVTGPRILLYCDSLRSAELNCIFQYYKISAGIRNAGIDHFFNGATDAAKRWNPKYLSWRDMQRWELREWFSLLYPQWVLEWIDSEKTVSDDWLRLSNSEILSAPAESFLKIINFCNLTLDGDIHAFADYWLEKQKYVLDEFDLLDAIVSCTLSNQELAWESLGVIAEAILQQRFRALNFELMCDSLNIFPTSSKDLYKLLIKV